jgi:hypothetical protein
LTNQLLQSLITFLKIEVKNLVSIPKAAQVFLVAGSPGGGGSMGGGKGEGGCDAESKHTET